MAQPYLAGYGLYQALKDEGITLPDDCGDITLEAPVDGAIIVNLKIIMTGEKLAKVGRALVRLAEANK